MFAEIDWSRRWYDSVRPAFARLDLAALGLTGALNEAAAALALVNQRGQPIRFVPQAELPEGRAYEEFIGATGCVPTRENLHDYFNALVWLTFPAIKCQLNALQAAQIAAAGVGKSRGPARDAATIFDENAALLVVADSREGHALVEALRAHEWRAALLEGRPHFAAHAELMLFGHALMEKLVAPRKAITAHTRVLFVGADYFGLEAAERIAFVDDAVSRELAEDELSTACFTPLPVLGVPGWWEGQDEAFYADATVFRPKRRAA
ncbi:MAG TPA: DUF3025 domain-containing protein [Telluria sp.]|nr:DUF3025 domain-containing protein [Telluria sp.]